MEALAKSPDRRYQSAEDLRSDLMRFSEGQPVRAAQRDVAFFGADATRAVSKVAPGERTQAVPMMTGPRTDIHRRRGNSAGIIASRHAPALGRRRPRVLPHAKDHAVGGDAQSRG